MEAIQSGNQSKYCREHNLSHRTFINKLKQYRESDDKENWFPKSRRNMSHRVITHSVEKLAVDRYKTEYDITNKPRDGSVLELLLIQEYAKKLWSIV